MESSSSRAARSRDEKVEFLRRMQSRPGGRQVIETHFAWVFLTDSQAYKMKKPLHQDSMDYRTLSARARGCREELRLNRRLAPSVYLKVAPLSRRGDATLVLGRGRQVLDWIVVMRRLPANRGLDRVLARRVVKPREVDALVGLLAAFYRGAQHRPVPRHKYLAALHARTRVNRRELLAPDLHLKPGLVEEAARLQLRFLRGHADLVGARAGRLVDGHGDLRPEHVFLGTGHERPVVIDCLEFDSSLRRLDPAEEAAFLALECRRLGAARFASHLLQGLLLAMQDPVPAELLFFYMSQRASTRAKLAAWHLRDAQFAGQTRHWIRRANSYLTDAVHFARLALRVRAEPRQMLSARAQTGAKPLSRRRLVPSPGRRWAVHAGF